MQKVLSAAYGILALASSVVCGWTVEPVWEYAVQVSATVQASPATITLSWPQDSISTPSSYTIYRKAPGATSWGSGTILAGSATSFVDSGVSLGASYEYQIVKANSGRTGYGYILAGAQAPLVESRGKVILVVDNTHAGALAAELARLQQDLVGDGWSVVRRDVARTDTVATVKNVIRTEYNADPANVKSVFLFGRVAVPYSGLQNPDGHSDHYGAWPADVFYGDVDGTWTDSSVNYQQTLNTDAAERTRISNVPGDGKFDQLAPPSAVELQVGRVDLSKMPGRTTWGGPATFPSELELLRNYLNKDHNFRHKVINPQRRGVVGDYFGVRDGEAFAASGYRNFAPLFGSANVVNLNTLHNDAKGVWIPHLKNNDYLWAYGCGAGSYATIGGLGSSGLYNDGSTVELVNNDVRAVFGFLFGSWLGDWDTEDNILRSLLATPTYGLASAWSGRPHWFTHQMALGETIGSTARLTQNNGNNGLYRTQINSVAGGIHIALMGDPTLRLHAVAPAKNLGGTTSAGLVNLSWTGSAETVLGYHVYRANNVAGPYTRLTSVPVSNTGYSDTSAPAGTNTYMVRALKLEVAGSGSYTNASQGAFWSIGTSGGSTPGDSTAPTITMTAPANNATVSGSSVTISATATDAVGVAGVQFKLDGANLGAEDTSAPYSFTWNAASATAGSHTLTAVARDAAGNQKTATALTVMVSGVSGTPTTNSPVATNSTPATIVVWVDDALPAGAGPAANGGDSWNWVSSPAPFSGSVAHQSVIAAGMHSHNFNWASAGLTVNAGETLFTYVYIDPANPPTELMLSWNADNWEHRAYWGANQMAYGTDGTASRRNMGPLPAAGQWARLEVPASQVGLEGQRLIGMSFALYGGRATWDYTGKSSGGSSTTNNPPTTNNPSSTLPTVTILANDANAAEAGQDPGVFTIARTGSATTALAVSYAISGTATTGADFTSPGNSVTIGAGFFSTTLNVTPIDDSSVESSETIVLTLAANAAYTVGALANATITIADNDTSGTPGTNTPPTTNNAPPATNNAPPTVAGYTGAELPKPGDHALNIISPTMLEVYRVNAKQPDPAVVDSWDLVDANMQFKTPALSEFAVKVNGQTVAVQSVGFKRRPSYAPLAVRDLRIDNCLYLKLTTAITDGQSVEVKNPSGVLWGTNMQFTATVDPLRFSPAIHVNHEGYMPTLPKKAMVGYFLGNLGELDVPVSSGFKIVDANTGAQVYQGTLKARLDVGFSYSPLPYQKVLEADFTSFNTPGEYRLQVPGLGASFSFLIDAGVAMAFNRSYALGLYHQRCGTSNSLPFTRHTHDLCHAAPADVPSPGGSYAQTWNVIALENGNYASNPRHTAPQMKDEASQLYPFVNKGKIDVSRGHHDAGDYSKYTVNSAALIHNLMFTVDSVAGGTLDNLGLPESGDGIADLLQEAKWEADFLAKMQDADGGFYFLVYPRDRRYEGNVTPDKGDPQVVWPKNTVVTAASVAALAQIASSPKFKQHYPAEAALYLQKAQLGWQFLINAIARHGKDGAYQKITFYGDEYMHDDELAWAACQMYLATGDAAYHQKLQEWFPDPSDSATFRWGWWRLQQGWGNVIRSYAFAARSGRIPSGSLNAAYLGKCESQIKLAANDAVKWSQQSAYGTSFPEATKAVRRAGWYFSSDHASSIATAHALDPRADYIEAVVANMNYEGGCNPVNSSFVTGLGWKRQRDVVHQYAQNDRRVLPPSGIPQGNVVEGFYYMQTYKGELNALCFPSDWTTTSMPYPMYDRWSDSFNVMNEFVHLNQARSLLMFSLLSSLTPAKDAAWKSGTAQITVPSTVAPVGEPVTLSVTTPGLDLSSARVVWEGRDQQPAYGSTFSFVPKNNGPQWVEVEVQMADGRRVFATNSFQANSPTVVWVDDSLPSGATVGVNGGDSWNWVSNPTPFAGSLGHQSTLSSTQHEHYFDNAIATLDIGTGDILFAYVYLDAANPPRQIMLQWNDGNWDHRAYWGENLILNGNNGTVSRRSMGALPASGQWVRLEIPASAVGLENRTLKGMAFSLYGGRVTWDCAGKTSTTATGPDSAAVTVAATDPKAAGTNDPGVFTVSRTGSTTAPLSVSYAVGGTAVSGTDYNPVGTTVTIPVGANSATVSVQPKFTPASTKTVVLTLANSSGYTVGSSNTATVTINTNTGVAISSISKVAGNSMRLSWAGSTGHSYSIFWKNKLTDPTWTQLSTNVTATGTAASWTDPTSSNAPQRFYRIELVN